MFTREEKLLCRVENLLHTGGLDGEAQATVEELSCGYRKILRQMRRLIAMGDRMQEELQRSARTDSLTGLTNRRHFMELAQRELARALRGGTSASLSILDVDHFKKVNDSYGHDAGDHILKMLSGLMTEAVREVDVVARFGGEEFVILFPDTCYQEAQAALERLRDRIAKKVLLYNEHAIQITVSLGLTSTTTLLKELEHSKPASLLDGLLQYADIALYAAKKNGRNRLESYAGRSQYNSVCPDR